MNINELDLPPQITLRAFGQRDELTRTLADEVTGVIRAALAARGEAALALSGGRTPIPLFEQLRRTALDWSATRITLADDRCVPTSSPDSNAGLIRRELLQAEAAEARFIPLWLDQYEGVAAADLLTDCRERLSLLPDELDLVILGMGNDGHTASLFPCAPTRDAVLASSYDCELLQPTTAPYQRLTLTPSRLLRSRQHILHLCGEDKLQTLISALQPGDPAAMPIRLFLAQPLTLYWSP